MKDRRRTKDRGQRFTPGIVTGIAVCLVMGAFFPVTMTAYAKEQEANGQYAGEQSTLIVTYESLSELLKAGSIELKQANSSYETNVSSYQKMLDQLREERSYMNFLAEQNEEDAAASAVYKSNASMLGTSIRQISNQVDRMTTGSSARSAQDNQDSYTRLAQTRMNAYNQMVLRTAAQEAAVEAAQSSYEGVQMRQAAGLVSADEVLTAADTLTRQQNQLASYRQQTQQQRRSLLTLLGVADDGNVRISTVPEPDLAAIAAIDYEDDKRKAIGSNDSLNSILRNRADTTAEVDRKAKKVAEAEGNAEADFAALYQSLMQAQAEYLAAEDAYAGAELAYRAVCLKYQAGMLDREGYLQGNAQYLTAVADRGMAAMGLVQTFEDYRWGVKGVS